MAAKKNEQFSIQLKHRNTHTHDVIVATILLHFSTRIIIRKYAKYYLVGKILILNKHIEGKQQQKQLNIYTHKYHSQIYLFYVYEIVQFE